MEWKIRFVRCRRVDARVLHIANDPDDLDPTIVGPEQQYFSNRRLSGEHAVRERLVDDADVGRVGAIVIKHTQLEHVLRLCLKRLHTLSIDSPEYDGLMKDRRVSTRRQQIRDALAASKLDSAQQKEVLQLLLDAEDLSELRNSLAHDTWARKTNEPLMLVNDKTRRAVAVP